MDRPYANEVNYWRTGESAPDTWIDKAKRDLRGLGAKIIGHMVVEDEEHGRYAYCLAFVLQGERYQIKWPVLQPRPGTKGGLLDAKRQAATALYYDVKAMCTKAKFLGAKPAFMMFWQLPDGRTAAEAGNAELADVLPAIVAGIGQPKLTDGQATHESRITSHGPRP
jgi:hypothetical protein